MTPDPTSLCPSEVNLPLSWLSGQVVPAGHQRESGRDEATATASRDFEYFINTDVHYYLAMVEQSDMPAKAPAVPTRMDRRKARTRAALIAAAQQLLADGRVEVSIQEITETADVGFGSFYNHFSDKAELWDTAVVDTLRQHGDLVAAVSAHLTDPAEVFCVGMRLTGRLQRQFPEMARVLLNSGPQYLLADEGLAPMALRGIKAAMASGRFDVENAELALVMAGGTMLGLLKLLDARPEADAGALADECAARVLRGFGVSRADAKKVASRPLPDLPS